MTKKSEAYNQSIKEENHFEKNDKQVMRRAVLF
jgi:hypothetical protein